MKEIKHYILWLLLGVLATGCQKEAGSLIPDDLPRMDEICASYNKTLQEADKGWLIEYTPAVGTGAFNMHMTFKGDTVHMESDYYINSTEDYRQQSNVHYRVSGVVLPEITFETYSVFARLYERASGNFEFEIKPDSSGGFWLNPIHLADKGVRFHLIKATDESLKVFKAKVDMQSEIRQFVLDPTMKYFRQIDLKDIANNKLQATAVFQSRTNSILLVYQKDGQTQVDSYPYKLAADGIELTKPINVGNQQLSALHFGTRQTNGVYPIGDAAKGISGTLTPVDTALYSNKGVGAALMDGQVQYEISGVSQLVSDDYYRKLLLLNGYYTTQLYFNWTTQSGDINQNLYTAVETFDGGATYDFHSYYLKPTIKDEDKLFYQFLTFKTTVASGFSGPKIYTDPFVTKVLLDPKGLTVVPAASGVFTLISRSDSRYWFTVTLRNRKENTVNE
ncbi:DUF4302 domain-containing protein [Pedobacter sp. HMF7647]|uniref:DUF4302 domain-containing protein n=1 Tax=Hufsiella arboris TaxID=2695275 RepID=A0A7K1YCN4_9SPHI|nr:DUF4302 domain-containing protein [Hufsiella arboris]MXV52344.1 DUF4302 domain-containing protein [Hufsiella arboris]